MIKNTYLGTPWNHIETAIAYDRGLPIMVLRDDDLKAEGFLELSYDWKVQSVDFDTDFLTTKDFESMLQAFSEQVEEFKDGKYKRFRLQNISSTSTLTIGGLVSNMSLEAFLQFLALLAAMLSTAFIAGMYFPQ